MTSAQYLAVRPSYFTDATMLGSEMYLLDDRQCSIRVVDLFEPRYMRSLSLAFLTK